MNMIKGLFSIARKLAAIPIVLILGVLKQVGFGNETRNRDSSEIKEYEGGEGNERRSKNDLSDEDAELAKYFYPQYYWSLIVKLLIASIRTFLRLIVVFGAFSFSSVIITLFAYYLMSLPNIVEKDLSLSFVDDTTHHQHAKIFFNCTIVRENCSRIDALKYQVLFEFEVVRNDHSMQAGNFEVEMNHMINDEMIKTRKISFLETNDYYVDLFYKVLHFPLKLLGYKKNELVVMQMINHLDNTELGLDFVDITIKNERMNILKPKIVFMPEIGFITSWLWSLRVLTLPTIFIVLVIAQAFIYFIIKAAKYAYSKLFESDS